MTTVRVERLPHAEGLPLPAYETSGSAGMDLRAAVAEDAPLTLARLFVLLARHAPHARASYIAYNSSRAAAVPPP